MQNTVIFWRAMADICSETPARGGRGGLRPKSVPPTSSPANIRRVRQRTAGLEVCQGKGLRAAAIEHNVPATAVFDASLTKRAIRRSPMRCTEPIRRGIAKRIFLSTVLLRRFCLEVPILAQEPTWRSAAPSGK